VSALYILGKTVKATKNKIFLSNLLKAAKNKIFFNENKRYETAFQLRFPKSICHQILRTMVFKAASFNTQSFSEHPADSAVRIRNFYRMSLPFYLQFS